MPRLLMITRLMCLLLAALRSTPQQSARQPSDPVIRVTVDLVQVDAVVTDSQGRQVADLKPEDFEILEDGKLQNITHFSWVSGTATPRSIAPPNTTPKTPGTASHEETLSPAKALQQDQVRRSIVLIADDLGLASEEVPAVRAAMKKFVEGQMQQGDLVSIMTTSGGMGAMQQLTNNKRQLYAAIERIHWSPGRTGFTWYQPTNIGDAARAVQTESNNRLNAVRSPIQTADTLGAVAFAIQGLREIPGRKAIALFSDGFTQSAHGIIAGESGVGGALYLPIREGSRRSSSASSMCVPVARARKVPKRSATRRGKRQAFYRASQSSLAELARGTGGIFISRQQRARSRPQQCAR